MDDFNREKINELIAKYKMNELERQAMILAFIWMKLAKAEYPKQNTSQLKSSGDPRKSLLFKHCYKFVNEKKGLIPVNEYRLYVIAQLRCYKNFIQADYARIEADILHGEKAWKRWKAWKAIYDRNLKTAHQDNKTVGVKVNYTIVRSELEQTKKFLFEELIQPTKSNITEIITNRQIISFVTRGKISPYYVLLSPFVKDSLVEDFDKAFNFDLNVYRLNIDSNIQEMFKAIFDYEF